MVLPWDHHLDRQSQISFLANLENHVLKNINQHSPKLYLRYVDGVFAVFENNNACLSFLNFLNTQHKNIKFTLEHSSDFICFLDASEARPLRKHL